MSKINLHEFKGKDFKEKIDKAFEVLKENKNSTLIIDPGTYVLTTERAREAQDNVMNGVYGWNPQPVMFNPAYVYDRGLDFDGHKGTRIEAYGVTLIVDGFMEPISVRNCSGIEILGLTIDHKRKPYSRGTIASIDGDRITVKFSEKYPITKEMPYIRSVVCKDSEKRFLKGVGLGGMEYIDSYTATFTFSNIDETDVGNSVYLWHTFHSRPAILIENAEKTLIQDVTINSNPGMGITAMHSKDIYCKRLKVVPSAGEFMSTNTDATHIASCRGKMTLDNCMFVGMGDDTINCHTYYHDIIEINGNVVKSMTKTPDGTHTQSVDYFEKGDKLQLISRDTLAVLSEYTVISCNYDESGVVITELDRAIECDAPEACFVLDSSAVPELIMDSCTSKYHFARGALVKVHKATIKNCTMIGVFEQAIKIDPESSWREAMTTDDILISGCRFIDCASANNLCGGVYVHTECPVQTEKTHGKVVIENCEISCPEAKYAVVLQNVKETSLINNKLTAGEIPVLE